MRNDTFALPKGTTATLQAGTRPVSITCVAGLVWATIEGSTTDHLVRAGETACFDRRGSIVIEALRAATVRVERGRENVVLTAYPPGSRTMSNTPVAVP
jgi:hypothetical protein